MPTHRQRQWQQRRRAIAAERQSGALGAAVVTAFAQQQHRRQEEQPQRAIALSSTTAVADGGGGGGGGSGGGGSHATVDLVDLDSLAEQRRATLSQACSGSADYQKYLHRFCEALRSEFGKPELVTDGVTSFHDPPCERLEELRAQGRPTGETLQPQLSQISTVLFINFLTNLRVKNRFKGPKQGTLVKPGIGTHNWFRNAMAHAFKIAKVSKPAVWDQDIGEYLTALKKQQQKEKERGTYEARHTGGRDKMDFDVFRRSMFDFVTGALSSNNTSNKGKKRNKTSDVDLIVCQKFCVDFWNYMCRSDNVKTINHSQIRYTQDHRTYHFHVSKNDQTGQKLSTTQDRHTYANPCMPEIFGRLVPPPVRRSAWAEGLSKGHREEATRPVRCCGACADMLLGMAAVVLWCRASNSHSFSLLPCDIVACCLLMRCWLFFL